jgi:cysteine desulfurase / selenocysteine lyase
VEVSARRYEGGTYNTAGIFGLHAALRMLLDVEPARSEAHILNLAHRLTDGFAALGIPAAWPNSSEDSRRSGITAFRLSTAADDNEIIQFYRNNGIFISVRSGMLRIAPHFWNTTDEIDAVVSITGRMPRLSELFVTA